MNLVYPDDQSTQQGVLWAALGTEGDNEDNMFSTMSGALYRGNGSSDDLVRNADSLCCSLNMLLLPELGNSSE